MDRQFYPGFGPGPYYSPYNPFYPPFFFPRRRFFPFFFLSPFFFPFVRGEENRDGMYFTQHQCSEEDTLGSLAQMYNCPQPILEAMNPHLQNPHALAPGSIVHIPRLDKMYCHKMYFEQDAADAGNVPPGFTAQAASPYTGTSYPGTSYPGTSYPNSMYPGL